jgi:hypothetical protein
VEFIKLWEWRAREETDNSSKEVHPSGSQKVATSHKSNVFRFFPEKEINGFSHWENCERRTVVQIDLGTLDRATADMSRGEGLDVDPAGDPAVRSIRITRMSWNDHVYRWLSIQHNRTGLYRRRPAV